MLDGATPENAAGMSALAAEYGAALGVSGGSLSEIYDAVKARDGDAAREAMRRSVTERKLRAADSTKD